MLELENTTAAVEKLAQIAETVQSLYCCDEPDGQIAVQKITRCAERLVQICGGGEAIMDGYRKAVFGEMHRILEPIPANKIAETVESVSEFILQLNIEPDEQDELLGCLANVSVQITQAD